MPALDTETNEGSGNRPSSLINLAQLLFPE
jgi:hypothetical protein